MKLCDTLAYTLAQHVADTVTLEAAAAVAGCATAAVRIAGRGLNPETIDVFEQVVWQAVHDREEAVAGELF